MVDVKFFAQRVAELVRGEVLPAAEAGQAVVRQGACPHDLAHGRFVMRVTHSGGAVFQHDAQQRLGQLIRQSVIGDGVKIPVERVHENVAHAARDLMHRERRGEQGVENGEGRAVERGVEAALFACLCVGQNGGVARLAAGCRDGQHNADGHGSCQRRAALPELPDICAGVGRAVGDGLAGVDDAAAADRQNQLRTRFQRQLHALAGQRRARVRLHAAERAILNARLVQKPEHAVKQSTFLRARAAIDDQHARKSAFFQQLRQLLCAACAEHDLSRYEIFKSVHMLILRRSLP